MIQKLYCKSKAFNKFGFTTQANDTYSPHLTMCVGYVGGGAVIHLINGKIDTLSV